MNENHNEQFGGPECLESSWELAAPQLSIVRVTEREENGVFLGLERLEY